MFKSLFKHSKQFKILHVWWASKGLQPGVPTTPELRKIQPVPPLTGFWKVSFADSSIGYNGYTQTRTKSFKGVLPQESQVLKYISR